MNSFFEMGNLSQADLYKMMYDSDPDIRWRVAKRIDQKGLRKMVNDPNRSVRLVVKRRLNIY